MLISCAEPTTYANTTPEFYIADVTVEDGTGSVVRLPREALNMSTPDGKAKAKQLIVSLTISDRRNARGYNNLKNYHQSLKRIYNKKPKKNQSTPIS